MRFIKSKKVIYPFIVVILLVGVYLVNNLYDNQNTINKEVAVVDSIEPTGKIVNKNQFYVDIKGAVKRPSVYKVEEGMIVNDLIEMAGGLTKNAYTKNLNLSLKLTEGMVVYVFNKNEVSPKENKNDATCTTQVINYDKCITNESGSTNNNSSLVNINTASKEELMTVTGIGESKAIAIIEYRKINRFNSIEDIKNVSGIGESLFAKIQSYITV